jgi:phage shock protein PspC (stress-responsive transcriptional regulator)
MTGTPQQQRVNTENLRDYSQLRRSVTDRKIAGVAGGLGRHLNVDPTILRVAFVVLCFFGGAGFVLYGAAWLLVPEDGQSRASVVTSPSTRNTLLAGAAILAGLLLIGDSWGGFWFPWPLAIIGLVVFLIMMNRDTPVDTNQSGQHPGSTPPPGGTTTTFPEAGTDPATEPTTEYDAQPPAPPWMPPTQQAYQPPTPRPDSGPKLFWFTLALVAIGVGALGFYDVLGGTVIASAYAALALTIVGAMLVVGAWVGRAGGLIFLGVVAAIALAISSTVVNTNWDGDKQIDAHPLSAVQVQDSYDMPAGTIDLDLSDVRDLEGLDGRTIEVEANAGEIVVTLPPGLDVAVDADVSVAGEAEVLGERTDGLGAHLQRFIDGGVDAPRLDLDIHLLAGSIEVRHEG